MKTLSLALTAWLGAIFGALARESPAQEARILEVLLQATQDNDLEKFKSACDETMRAAMTREKLADVSGQVSRLMRKGYKTEYMGALDRGAYMTHYWKLDFNQEGAADLLAELSIQNGKVAGFFIR